MKDPQRLLDAGASAWELQLLRAGDSELPSDTSRRAAMAAAGLGVGVSLAANVAAAGAVGRVTTLARLGAFKPWLIGALVSGSVLGGAIYYSRAPAETTGPNASSSSRPPLPVQAAAAAAAPIAEPSAESEATASSLPERPSSTAPTRVPGASNAPGIQGQIELIDRARGAAASGKPSVVLATLDEYEHRYPKGVLGQEAALLRIEALLARGDRATASRLMKSFLARYPRSALAPRVRTLLGD